MSLLPGNPPLPHPIQAGSGIPSLGLAYLQCPHHNPAHLGGHCCFSSAQIYPSPSGRSRKAGTGRTPLLLSPVPGSEPAGSSFPENTGHVNTKEGFEAPRPEWGTLGRWRVRQARGRGPGHPWLCQGRGGRSQLGPRVGVGRELARKVRGAVPWTLTWGASHSCWAPAANVSLGANGPGKSPGTNSVWGRNLISSGLLLPRPRPPSQHLPSRGSSGALGVSLAPGSPGVGGGGPWVIQSPCP